MRLQFNTKGLLRLTVVVGLVCGIAWGPKKYVTTAYISYGSLPSTSKVHPRFIQYELDQLTDEQVIDAELSYLTGSTVIARAEELLKEQDIAPKQYGGDLKAWLEPRLNITRLSFGAVQINIAHRESWQAGTENYGRKTMAWQTLVALLTAYQEDALGRTSFTTGSQQVSARYARIPFLSVGRVDRRLW
jgi:hypothetical protein